MPPMTATTAQTALQTKETRNKEEKGGRDRSGLPVVPEIEGCGSSDRRRKRLVRGQACPRRMARDRRARWGDPAGCVQRESKLRAWLSMLQAHRWEEVHERDQIAACVVCVTVSGSDSEREHSMGLRHNNIPA